MKDGNAYGFEKVEEAFNRQSPLFDGYEESNPTLIWMRRTIHRHVETLIHPGERLLDLNAGTGTDAIYFAQRGLSVHAIDISQAMLERLKEKATQEHVSDRISVEHKSFTNLSCLQDGPFNHIFSNFGGLNCIKDPSAVISQFGGILVPGGTVTLVVMPPMCPWELAVSLRGNFRMAFRRLKRGGTHANVEGIIFKTYYHSPAHLVERFGAEYSVAGLRGLCAVVPPPNFNRLAYRHPKIFRRLTALDERLCTLPPFSSWADHYILTMRYNT